MKILSLSETDTFHAGRKLAEKLSGGDIVLLSGFLGAGKTVFTKGIAAGLGVAEELLSPTFAIMCEYRTKDGLTLCHVDAYRLKDAAEAEEAGITESFGAADTVAVVEWFENIQSVFAGRKCMRAAITATGETKREITIDHE